MLDQSRTVAFLATQNAGLARAFYRDRLGLTLVYEDDFAIVFRLLDTELRLQKVNAVTPAPYTVLGWAVASIEATALKMRRAGVSFERFEHLEQDPLGVWDAPSGARIAWFKDPDGNILSLTQQNGA